MQQSSSIKFILILAILCAVGLSFPDGYRAKGSSLPGSAAELPVTSPVESYVLNLPLIGKSYPTPPPVYGVETRNFFQWKVDKANQANVYWLRNAAFSWAEIEPNAPNPSHVYLWDVVDNAGLIDAYNRNLRLVAVVRDTPVWARMPKYSAYLCGPIVASALDEYAQFAYELVQRYSQPPYNIHYYEFGNEPDVEPAALGANYNSQFGCWGDGNDPYYGGRYYAEMLKRVYPAVKAASPESQVLIGGLLLYCDPTHPPVGKNCLPGKFTEGILLNQGGAYFDILSFHGYSGYSQGQIIDESFDNFAVRGGQIVGKVDFLRSVMSQFGINKPVMMSETALNCWPVDECTLPSENFLQLQADYVVSAYVRSWGLNLLGSIWFTLEDSGWQQSGLHTGKISRPAYDAYVFMTQELKDATIGSPITQYTGLRGYQFTTSTRSIWVLWSPDGLTAQTIPLPNNVSQIYNKYGQVEPITNPLTILHPTYLEFLY